MIKNLPHLCACLALTAVGGAQANTTQTNLIVGGQITPPACNVSVDGASGVDFGDIPFRTLDPDGTLLKEQHSRLEIACGGPTRVAFTAQDNRANSTITHQEAIAAGLKWPYQNPENGMPHAWGLGRIDDVKIGAAVLLIRPEASLIDGKPPAVDTMQILARAAGSSSSWPVHSAQDSINLNLVDEYSFGAPAAAAAITNASVSLAVLPLLNKPAALPIAKEIPIDGSVTFTLRYL
ncbi:MULTISPECIES: DUF1120 domain-containing protein [Achromobacter]|uniref:DUF1120 domain-containing protein n=1 Tax=Achromobacter TaxID=222 RepID=UPI0006C614A8|nr:DUF1120 domain-containing protein [Achromobacter kerstersii]CUJ61615.1 Protein of uncharacterised function (DUF1120) [Achromobacter kerstersii]